MADARRGIRWRAAWFVAAVVLLVVWRVAGGRAGGHVVQIQFGMVPELEGATVLIDQEAAGTLAKRGSRTVTGFRVDEGEHLVQVGMESCPGEPARVTLGFGAGTVMLLAEIEDRYVGGAPACRVVLRQ
ncbi:MAG: hypothetical protein Q8N53_17315 [Longimicrobiales bacterium]|nr:hypothetical protein [Longimicrobiales bacterium]